eukprot:TRINITY_DN1106_c0_g1_i6.p1 TRINITY_DN1106_c0_g1~~TRINITY_DN1106_c0_g1_i6.p1  ORF type:complete len:400 (+),score=127.21 TRINITY_DN1106_c0_g1_i6:176-1375(+)
MTARVDANLFVSGLHETVDETALLRHFGALDSSIQVRRARILRSNPSMRSRGSAIVEFASVEDAEKALKTVNYTQILGKEIQLGWYHLGGIKDRVTGNVFVKNLPGDYSSRQLFDLFSRFGKISSCRVVYDAKGECKGYGYVQFENKEVADTALKTMNGEEVNGSKIEVVFFKVQETRSNAYNNLFVKFIPKRFTDEDLKNLFAPYGEITSAAVMKEKPDSAENRGFGFVCFKNTEDAKLAEEKLKNTQIEGQILYVAKALALKEHKKRKREERYQQFKDCNLYVKNFEDTVKDEDLKKAFEPFGNVISAKVMMELCCDPVTGKKESRSKRFGFVCYSNTEEAKRAIAGAESQEILGKKLVVAVAERKEDRVARFMQGFYQAHMNLPLAKFLVIVYPNG